MRALIQRVEAAEVSVDGERVAKISCGLLVLAGIHRDDQADDGEKLIKKILSLRIFEDDAGKMGRSVTDIHGTLLIVSQFTLFGALNKGTRPDFSASMSGESARQFFHDWMLRLRASTNLTVEEGRFGAHMKVRLINDGPVTLMLDSRV